MYRAVAAQRSADRDRLRVKARRVESDPRVLAAVNLGLSQAWSPRQIAARLVLDHPQDQELRLSHEAIYQALHCQARGQLKVELVGALRRGGTKRVSRGERRAVLVSKAPIKDMVMITDRPAEADRAGPGHWESQWCCQAALAALGGAAA